jgi:hypothetical protein
MVHNFVDFEEDEESFDENCDCDCEDCEDE